MNNYYVYEWIRLDTNEPFYVGKGKGDRWKILTRGNNHHFNNIVKSIPVAVNILHNNLTEDIANDLEVWYIREYRDIIGYDICNIADGGEGHGLAGKENGMYGKHHSDESKNKISEINKGRHRSDESKKKISEAIKGENHPWYGKHHTEETKKKISENHADMKGENNPMYGKQHSEETKKKIGNRKYSKGKDNVASKSVICITTMKVFYSITEAMKEYGIKGSADIGHCCEGYRIKKGKKVKVNQAGKLTDGTPLVWKFITIIPL